MKIKVKVTIGFLIIFLSQNFLSLNSYASFSDTKNDGYEESIEFLANRHVVEGYEDGRFGSKDPLNRAEMLKILLETQLKGQVPGGQNCFKDVAEEWFAKYVCTAKEKGFIEGYADGNFRPEQKVNMVEGLKMALESFDLKVKQTPEGEWYSPYVNFAHESSLFSKHSYLPDRPMTRGEMAFLVHQLILNQEGTKLLTKSPQYWSAGCGKNPPSTPPTNSTVNGMVRHYITVIPKDYDQNTPKKLIFAFHGRTNSNTQVRGYYKVEEAENGAAIMIYPSGLPEETSPRNWQNSGDKASNLRDYALFDQVLAEFSDNYCVDLDQVYVVGHSLGAWFTNSLACFRGDVIRGIGSLGGGTSIGNCTGPVATMIWHNPNDNLAPVKTGEQARDQYLKQNQCTTKTHSVEPSWANCVEYEGCYEDAPVIWCPHTIDGDGKSYYPHTWPNGTGSEMWKFFQNLAT